MISFGAFRARAICMLANNAYMGGIEADDPLDLKTTISHSQATVPVTNTLLTWYCPLCQLLRRV